MAEMVDILNLTRMHEVLHMFGMFPEKGSQIKHRVFAKGYHSILVRQQVDWKDGMPYSLALASKKPGYEAPSYFFFGGHLKNLVWEISRYQPAQTIVNLLCGTRWWEQVNYRLNVSRGSDTNYACTVESLQSEFQGNGDFSNCRGFEVRRFHDKNSSSNIIQVDCQLKTVSFMWQLVL